MSKRIFLIGGSAGAGKTTCARLLARELGAGWLQVDTLWIAAQEVAGPDSAAYPVLRIDERIRAGEEPVEELVRAHIAASELLCSWLPRPIEFELQAHDALVVDGAWLTPSFMAAFAPSDAGVSAAVLHEADAAEVRVAMESRRAVPMVAPWHERGARAAWEYGNWLAEEAARVGISVVAARPRETLVARLRAALGV